MSTAIIIYENLQLSPSNLHISRGHKLFFKNLSGQDIVIKLPGNIVDNSTEITLKNGNESDDITISENAPSGDHIFRINDQNATTQDGRGGGTGKIHVND